MVVSAQEGVSSCTNSKVTASCIHQDVQLMRWTYGGGGGGGGGGGEQKDLLSMFLQESIGL